jgi:SAM-dependent methyltransferase
MHLDVQDLRNFYYRSTLGRAAQTFVRAEMARFWPEAQGLTVAGFGFAAPLLRPYLSDAKRVIGLMPGPQGVMPWPAGMPNVSVLCRDTQWPIQKESVDKLVVLHGLETSEAPHDLIDECWRVLKSGGRAIFIVPNRAGLWARRDRTPFGYGRPYSLGQLEAQLSQQGLVPRRHVAALHTPPSEKRFWLRTARLWEGVGRNLPSSRAGGVLMVEVSKQVPKPRGSAVRERVLQPLKVLEGIPNPEAKPV